MNTKCQFQVLFFPTSMMEAYLSEKVVWVHASSSEEAQVNAQEELKKDEDASLYRMEDPIVQKVA